MIHGDPEDMSVLRSACVGEAESMVVDYSEEKNASVILSARELSSNVRIVSLVDNEEIADYIRYAGADEVILPQTSLGYEYRRYSVNLDKDEAR